MLIMSPHSDALFSIAIVYPAESYWIFGNLLQNTVFIGMMFLVTGQFKQIAKLAVGLLYI